jgi:23S rRNA pseudouridine1911/1915/1917 synthase
MTEPLLVLFEDAHCLAVRKPAGVLTQARNQAGEPTLEDAVRRHLCPNEPGSAYVATVHRLDRPVSGVVVWAKTPKAARRLAAQFAGRQVRKEYWAIVEGRPPIDEGVWEDWLCVDSATGLGRVQVCSAQAPRARRALTRFRRGEAVRLPTGCSWLIFQPETGRTHQLRVQAAARGLPIVGDALYGSGASGSFTATAGIALHARALTIHHPALQVPTTFTAPLPESWPAHGMVLPDGDGTARGGERAR